MISAVQAFIDAAEKGLRACAESWLPAIPAWQVEVRFADFAPHCHDRIAPDVERRPGNALNIEIGAPVPRCRQRLPKHWTGKGASATRWLASGGSPLVLGCCSLSGCPRAGAQS